MSSLVKRPVSRQDLIRDLKKSGGQCPDSSRIVRKRGDLLQLAFLFDTTGSMWSFFEACKKAIAKIVFKVAEKHRKTHFCYVPYKNHGDESKFDGRHPFFSTGFFNDVALIDGQLSKIRKGGGGDGKTALEDVFHYLADDLQWSPFANKAVVLIGDMSPHGVVDSINNCPHGYDYRVEVEKLRKKGIKVYSVFCTTQDRAVTKAGQKVQSFFEWIAENTEGKYLELRDIDDIVDLLIGICMKEAGHLDEFVAELGKLKKLPSSKKRLLLALNVD